MTYNPNTEEMPVLEALVKYGAEDIYPLHTPGHKGGRGMAGSLQSGLGVAAGWDVSLMSELDDIHEPRSYIRRAQQLTAEVYGSEVSFWAVNGTTQAIHAMLLTALAPGEKVLIPRNAHRSVAGGLILGGIAASYLVPDYLEGFGLHTQIAPAEIEGALRRDPEIRAVLLTSPNYYGVTADTEAIAKICHRHGVVLLVDEAHGPHLGFSEELPPSAMQCGADACAQSTHKLLGAMTQCSVLHVRGKLLDLQRAADAMSLLATTSPNYLLLASLDAAVAQLRSNGEKMVRDALMAAAELRELCGSFPGIKVLQPEDVAPYGLDRTKVTINFAGLGYTGVEAGELLRRAGVAAELTDAQNVLLLVTYADRNRDYEAALRRIAGVLQNISAAERGRNNEAAVWRMPSVAAVMDLRKVFYGAKESIPLAECAGRICAESVSFYPPGIPVLLPGELISEEAIGYCAYMKQLGLPVSGPEDGSLDRIRVVKAG